MTRLTSLLIIGIVLAAYAAGFATGRASLADALDACRDSVGEMMRQP